jgi:UDP-glucose 4-epimerase
MTKWIFITGGNGYIGSHVAAQLKETTDYSVMLIDRRAKQLPHTTRYCDMIADEDFASPVIKDAIRDYKPEAIVHLAADSTIGPSMINPAGTWENNVAKTLSLLDCCARNSIRNFIFASSSSVYADQDFAVDEQSQLAPYSPYASTKMAGEMMLKDWYGAHGLRSVSFRFFNVAGSHNKYDLGELNGSTHLLAKVMESAVHGTDFTVFGRNWPTADSTAIRDYTHVMDIADAVVRAVDWLPQNPGAHIINLGGGHGHSVQTVIDTTEMLLGKQLPYRYGPRRDGDSAMRFSNNNRALELLGWKPSRSLNEMILDSYKWYSSHMYQSLTNANILYTN